MLNTEELELVQDCIRKITFSCDLSHIEFNTSRYNYAGSDRYDITTRNPSSGFAPTPKMFRDKKYNDGTAINYINQYFTQVDIKLAILKLLPKKKITIVCFCDKDKFCHRFIVAEILKHFGAKYLGEI